jgi:hypothetical protein
MAVSGGFYKKVRGRLSAVMAFLTEKLNRFNALAAQGDPSLGTTTSRSSKV